MEVIELGQIEYLTALDRQMEELQKISEGAGDKLIFCSHPPIVTLGRSSKERDLFGWTGDLVEVSRGGRATYHGPSQLVVYPILNLQNPRRQKIPPKDLHRYLRSLEQGLINSFKEWGVQASIKNDKILDEAGDELLLTGVWVEDRKIASLGVAVKKWISYHGAAINLDKDPQAFQGINPCGFPSSTMVSLEELVERPIDRVKFKERLGENLQAQFR